MIPIQGWRTRLLARLTGGRPMTDEGFAFRDVVSGRGVRYFRDKLNRLWMAESPWAVFRVARPVPRPDRIRDMKTWTFRRDR